MDQEERIVSLADREELDFCNTSVLSNTGGFLKYGWNDIVDRCNNLESSGSILTTNRYYFHKDHLGSVVGISDNLGNIVSEYSYDSYGNYSLSGSEIGNDRLFSGREYDKEIGLYYFRARYYDSKLGRFISRDPIGQAGGINIYEYVKGNPVNYVDLDGLDPKDIIGGGIEIGFPNVDRFVGGAGLFTFGNATVGVFGPICADYSVTTAGCLAVLGPTGPGAGACIAPAVTAIASCGVTAVGGTSALAGAYLMGTSGESGSYTIKFKSGKEYHGKGPESRAKESAKREAKNNNDEVESINWSKAKDDKDAFTQEALRIKNSGGLGPNNYNRINSPGNKYLNQ